MKNKQNVPGTQATTGVGATADGDTQYVYTLSQGTLAVCQITGSQQSYSALGNNGASFDSGNSAMVYNRSQRTAVISSDGDLNLSYYWNGYFFQDLGAPASGIKCTNVLGMNASGKDQWIYVTGDDGQLYQYSAGKYWTCACLGKPPTGATVTAGAGVGIWSDSERVAVIDSSGTAWWAAYYSKRWNWFKLGTAGTQTLSTGVGIAFNGTYQYAYFIGTNGDLYLVEWDGTQWGWRRLGTPTGIQLSSSIGAAVLGGVSQRAFLIGSDGNVWVNYWSPSQADYVWATLGTPTNTTAVSGAGMNSIGSSEYVYVIGGDGALWQLSYDGSGDWTWQSMGMPS